MLNDIYNKRILALAADIPRLGRLPEPHGSAVERSKLCGSMVTVDLRLDGDRVSDFAHDVKACALGQASSSIMARAVVGASAGELKAVRDAVRAMLKEGAEIPGDLGPDGRWEDLAVLAPVRDFKARHASTLLTFDAVVRAVEEAMRREDAKAS
jgi:NifU-like protein involved in Fe-S cluster formation